MSETNGHTLSPGLLRTMAGLLSRTALASHLGWLFDGKRRLHEVLGYQRQLVYRDYLAKYQRQDIAHRLVTIYPRYTWAQPPDVTEDNDDGTQTPFEAAWEGLVSRLHVYDMLERADRLANIGCYSVLLIGLRGQSQLQVEATPVRNPDDVLYLTPYSEYHADVVQLQRDASQPNYGQPLVYRCAFARGNSNVPGALGNVHASRMLHIAEDLLEDDIYGLPRLAPVFDRLDDLLKVVGGAAEMFWRDARRRIAIALREGYRRDESQDATLTQEAEAFANSMQDYLRLEGADATVLEGKVAAPDAHVSVLLQLISATTGIPQRVLMGSERGELASTQDEHLWLAQISQRQQQFAAPRILRPLIDRLIALGALPEPQQPYTVTWPNLLALSEEKKAAVAKDVATALNQYAPGLADTVVPPHEFRERYLDLPQVPEQLAGEMVPLALGPGQGEM